MHHALCPFCPQRVTRNAQLATRDSDPETRPREACGLFGIHGHPEASTMCYFGLYALQHRGQESAGIAVVKDDRVVSHKGMGLVPDV
ncbi:MAG: hypothetical protein WCB15_02795, partial [Desulfobacterales bacterium]